MRIEMKNSAATVILAISANALKEAQAIMQSMRKHVDLRIIEGDEFAVHPDFFGANRQSPSNSRRKASRQSHLLGKAKDAVVPPRQA